MSEQEKGAIGGAGDDIKEGGGGFRVPLPPRCLQWTLSHGAFAVGLYLIYRWGVMSDVPNWSTLFIGIVSIMGGICLASVHISRRIMGQKHL